MSIVEAEYLAILTNPDTPQPRYGERRATLYRYFAADGRLLYIGITTGQFERMLAHSGASLWWTQAATCTLEHYPSESTVLGAERRAIAAERPIYNRVHHPDWNSPEVRAARKARRIAEQAERDRRLRLPYAWRRLMKLAASGAPIE